MVLVGRLKIPYQDLFILSNSEIDMLVYGHEIDIKERMEFERDMSEIMVSPYAKKGFSLRKEYPFEWDVKEEVEIATKEDFDKARKSIDIVKKLRYEQSKNRS